ncbi:hypothetical protein KJ682_06480 [bacterium]|nr:hypothetical protein [bacterium]
MVASPLRGTLVLSFLAGLLALSAIAQPPLPGDVEPGLQPRLWAPGLINTGLITRDVAMTPDQSEIYFCVATAGYAQSAICVVRWEDGAWTGPQIAPFSGDSRWMDLEPFISPDGRRFFFMSNRPAVGEETGDPDVWVMDRVPGGWSEPRNLGAPVNTPDPEYFPAVTREGHLYFCRSDASGVHRIFKAIWDGRAFLTPEPLPEAVNCGTNRFNATIDPEESRLIFTAAGVPGSPGIRYYQARRAADGTWTGPFDLGPAVNEGLGRGWSPYLSPDGKTFFFMSGRRIAGEDSWPLRWSVRQCEQHAAGTGNGNIWLVSAALLDDPGSGIVPADAPQAMPVPTVAFPRLEGPYLGQEQPGVEPRLFAPGVLSTGLNERDVLFAPDGRRLWYGLMDRGTVTVMTTHLTDSGWSEPVSAGFHPDPSFACFEPALSPDGTRMLFLSNQAAPGQTQGAGWANQNIFVSEGDGTGWSTPRALPAPVTTDAAEYFPSLARDGTLYFTREDSTGAGAVWAAEPDGEGYGQPRRLGEGVNCGTSAYNASVHPDERWLIVCIQGHRDNLGPADYWISFRNPQGDWDPVVNLGPTFNGPGRQAASASVSPDGRFLFFSRRSEVDVAVPLTWEGLQDLQTGRGGGGLDIWWVDAGILESLSPQR